MSRGLDPTIPPRYPSKQEPPIREKPLPKGTVTVFDKGPPDGGWASPVHIEMAAVDAEEACRIDPGRYKLAR